MLAGQARVQEWQRYKAKKDSGLRDLAKGVKICNLSMKGGKDVKLAEQIQQGAGKDSNAKVLDLVLVQDGKDGNGRKSGVKIQSLTLSMSLTARELVNEEDKSSAVQLASEPAVEPVATLDLNNQDSVTESLKSRSGKRKSGASSDNLNLSLRSGGGSSSGFAQLS